ncbi:MAG TPA: hypothetical protein VHZ09_03400 [Acidobacteriaceae bacterium]|nr:hypothetical protein [Acidobacteriaceae bacterium]
MKSAIGFLSALLIVAAAPAHAQSGSMTLPPGVTAGAAFSIPTSGSGSGTLYLVGPGQALRRDVQLGQPVSVAAGTLYNAGQYIAILTTGSGNDAGTLTVAPASQPDALSFLAQPSRLPVGQPNGVSGAAYVFDKYHNLITTPLPVSFDLSNPGSPPQAKTVSTRDGVAWTRMNSAAHEAEASFVARVGGVATTRVIDEVPGDPCGITMSAKPDGNRIQLATTPLRDCAGNPVPDGTVVTFTESRAGMQSTVDVPLKKGIAAVEMPSWPGATISVASGVVAGNEIRWAGGR